MPLPSPYDYVNWQDFAAALIGSLGEGSGDVVAGSALIATSGGGGAVVALPPNTSTVYWNGSLDELQVQTAPNLFSPFQIDTQSLALASVELGTIAEGAVSSAKILDLAVINAKIANATILSAKIGDAQIVEAKIGDLAVNTAKIANLAVNNAQIANAAINSAKIANLAVGAANIILLAVGSAQIADAAITTAKITTANITTALIANAAITSALIANLAVGTAAIADASIGTAKIADAAIISAKIGDLQVTTAKIADASITSAKILELVVSKITAGTLNAVIDVGTGMFRFTVGGQVLSIGRGFGTAGQFVMWFGPSMAESAMSEGAATFYLKTDGSAYFGGLLSSGVLHNALQSNLVSSAAAVLLGSFASNGHSISINCSFDYRHDYLAAHGTAAISADAGTTVLLEGSTNGGTSWTTIGSLTPNVTTRTVDVDSDPSAPDVVHYEKQGSTTAVWTPGASTTLQVRATITSYNIPVFSGSSRTSEVIRQTLALATTES